jgi:hypothetical protein
LLIRREEDGGVMKTRTKIRVAVGSLALIIVLLGILRDRKREDRSD